MRPTLILARFLLSYFYKNFALKFHTVSLTCSVHIRWKFEPSMCWRRFFQLVLQRKVRLGQPVLGTHSGELVDFCLPPVMETCLSNYYVLHIANLSWAPAAFSSPIRKFCVQFPPQQHFAWKVTWRFLGPTTRTILLSESRPQTTTFWLR